MNKKAIIKFPLNADIKDKRVLLMDDITEMNREVRRLSKGDRP